MWLSHSVHCLQHQLPNPSPGLELRGMIRSVCNCLAIDPSLLSVICPKGECLTLSLPSWEVSFPEDLVPVPVTEAVRTTEVPVGIPLDRKVHLSVA